MHSNANSNSPGAERSRYFTVRFARAVWRFIFNRRTAWTLVILASLVVLFYQYENWNGARELAAARQRMLARTATDNIMDLLPAEVPETDNFFAIPEIVSWRVPSQMAAGGYSTNFPVQRLFPDEVGDPPKILEEAGCHRLDMEGWVKSRPSGKEVPADQSAAAALLAELGDGNGLIPRLAEGLNRPYAQVIPCRRREIEAAGGTPLRARIPAWSNAFGFQRNLGIHLRAAALAGDARRTTEVAGIMLRLGDVCAGEPVLVSSLVGLALHRITLEAMNEALTCPALDESQYRQIQDWLAATNDVKAVELTFLTQLVETDTVFRSFKANPPQRLGEVHVIKGKAQPTGVSPMWLYGPSGWLDANRACASDWMLAFCGEAGDEVWRSGASGARRVASEVGPASLLFKIGNFVVTNPRRILACIVAPAISNVWDTSASNLLHRRCAILTSALHRHRLKHGSFPESLTALDAFFLPAAQSDLIQAGESLRYRRTEKGFLLWSAGDERNDDGGDAARDWTWRYDTPDRP